jgi:hypothetical protein
MELEDYRNNLELYSKRLPFESKMFIDTLLDFHSKFVKKQNHSDSSIQSDSIDLFNKYKLVLLYTLKIKCKLVEDLLISLIPNRMNELDNLVMGKKDYIFSIYITGVLTEEEYKDIYQSINGERMQVINRALENKIIIANLIPSFRGIKEVVKFAEKIKRFDRNIDITSVYQWRRRQRYRVILKWFGF